MTAVAEASTPTIGQAVRRGRFWAVVFVVLALAAIVTLVINGAATAGTRFGPDNAAPTGARALRSVLQQQGVAVDEVRRLGAARQAQGTLLVDDSDALLDAAAWRGLLAAHLRLVVVQPSAAALRAVLPGATTADAPDADTATAGCSLALAQRAGAMSVKDSEHGIRDSSATVCFADESGAGQLVTSRTDGSRVILLADATPFTNEHIAESGNAAVALNALGATARLVWYRPSPLDGAGTGPKTLAQLTPPWVTPAVVLLLGAGIAAAFWRGRRLGPLVIERLPVVVRSRETVEGRARLYARGAAHLRAADALRIGAIGRMAPMLGLSRAASVDDVVVAAAIAVHGQRDPVRAVLIGTEPRTDRELVQLSDDLARLEAAVRTATVPGAAPLCALDFRPDERSPPLMTDDLRERLTAVRTEVGKAVVGQDAAVTGLIIALLARGHVLLEGVPGVAKTLLVRTLSASLALETARVQFTPDLMPGDVTGSTVFDAATGKFDFRRGPVFTNLLLADEINRTPPKTQSSLLEAMEERQVTVDGVSRPLPDPFLVAATQNPVEYEGTYTLPEAQLDRFLMKLVLELPPRDEELEVLVRHADGFDPRDLAAAGVRAVLTPEDLRAARAAVQQVRANSDVLGYVVDLVRGTRQAPSVQLGVSPRGATALLAASRAWAWLRGAPALTPDHVQDMALPVLRHRIRLRPEAELEGVSVDAVLRSIIATVQVPL